MNPYFLIEIIMIDGRASIGTAHRTVGSYTQDVGPDSQVLLSVTIPTIAVLVGILINNRQIERLEKQIDRSEKYLDSQIGSLRVEMNARFQAAHEALLRVEGVLDARLRHLEESR